MSNYDDVPLASFEHVAEVEVVFNSEATRLRKKLCAEITRLREQLALYTQAVGLLSTLHPTMVIDIDDPVGMAAKVEAHIREQLAACRPDPCVWRMDRYGVWSGSCRFEMIPFTPNYRGVRFCPACAGEIEVAE